MGVGDHNNGGRTPAHPSAWCKIHLGWTEPTTITELPQIQNIPAVNDPDSTDKIYKIPVKGSNGREYFLIENRQQKGFDQGLPASGLLIWHVNEIKSMRYFPNNDPQNFFLTLEQSDGRGELEKNMFELKKKVGSQQAKKALTGDNGDPFPGETKKTVFDDKSLPNSKSHNNKHSCVVVDSISNSDNIMTAIMGVMCSSHLILEEKEPLWEEIPDDDRLRWIKEESSIDFYQNGYSQGYRQGYGDALKNMRK
jgi:immune inhibitor A